MIHNLLELTQMRLGAGIQIQPDIFDACELLRLIIEEKELLFPSRQLELTAPSACLLYADRSRLTQAIGNLVNNAAQHSPKDTPIRIGLGTTDQTCHIGIANHGPPISGAALAELFEPLRRHTLGGTNAGHSVGLGLHIVKEIVTAHGGSIAVASD